MAESVGLIAAAPVYNNFTLPKVKLPQIIRKEHEWPKPDQLETFMKAVRGKKAEIPALLVLHGLRQSELFLLEKSRFPQVLTWENSKKQASQRGDRPEGDIYHPVLLAHFGGRSSYGKGRRKFIAIEAQAFGFQVIL